MYLGRAKADVKRVLPDELRTKSRRLLTQYGSIPLAHFPTVWFYFYGEILDTPNLGFEDGLIGFFSQLSDFAEVECDEKHFLMCKLKPNARSNGPKTIISPKDVTTPNDLVLYIRLFHKRRRIGFLLGQHTLWSNDAHLLELRGEDLLLAKSPFEQARERNEKYFNETVNLVHQEFDKHPRGVPAVHFWRKTKIYKSLFSANSLITLMATCPELFHLDNDMTYDARTNTFKNLTSPDLPDRKRYWIAYMFIMSGLYQKTLLLLCKAGDDGLKLAVWKTTIESNFHDCPKKGGDYEKSLLDSDPITIFLCLTSFGLIKIRSPHDCKNDLRLQLPEKNLNYEEIHNDIVNYVHHHLHEELCRLPRNNTTTSCITA